MSQWGEEFKLASLGDEAAVLEGGVQDGSQFAVMEAAKAGVNVDVAAIMGAAAEAAMDSGSEDDAIEDSDDDGSDMSDDEVAPVGGSRKRTQRPSVAAPTAPAAVKAAKVAIGAAPEG